MSDGRVARFGLIDDAMAQDVAVRLMARLRVEGECWLWTGLQHRGYGKISLNATMEQTHVVAMFLRHGAQALAAETVNHLCLNRGCCNPDHLQFASIRENTLHGSGLAAQNAAKTHCVNGHELSPENVTHGRGGRDCRKCKRASDKRRTPRDRRLRAQGALR